MNTLKSQKGAMFGLDARIALAIFGGLSVIAGAAVFGTISQTQTTALTTEFDNIGKAYINFALDTGVDTATFTDLINDGSGILGWNGPYLTISSASHVTYGTYSLIYGEDAATGANPATCDAGEICAVWLELTGMADALAIRLDVAIDGGTVGVGTPTSGNFRVDTAGGSSDNHVHFKLSRRL